MRVYIGNDHGGVDLRDHVIETLTRGGHEVVGTVGPTSTGESVDYPDMAAEVCRSVQTDPGSFGVLLCGTGQGMAMCANRHQGIRAGVAGDVFSTRMLREHNNANVICLGARVLGPGLAQEIVETFFATPFGDVARHQRRIDKIGRVGDHGDPRGE